MPAIHMTSDADRRLGKALFEAVSRERNFTKVERLLDQGADPNYGLQSGDHVTDDFNGWTPLAAAAVHNLLEIATLLLQRGANVDKHDGKHRWTPLMRASDKGHERMVHLLVDFGANIDLQDTDGWTALFWAVSHNQIADSPRSSAICKYLIDKGASLELKDKTGSTALMYSVLNGHIEAIEYFGNSTINLANNAKWTPIMFSCQNGDPHITRLLLDMGAEVNRETITGVTPLIAAALKADFRSVQMLVESGANVNASAADGWTALFSACQLGTPP